MAIAHIRSPYGGIAVGLASLEFALDLRTDSMTEAAHTLGISPAAMSAAVGDACAALGLPRANSQRSEQASESYSTSQRSTYNRIRYHD